MKHNQVSSGIIELDIHGMTKYQAKICIDSQLKKADSSLYRIRIVHGYHNGTQLKELVLTTYRSNPKVKRIEVGLNQGITDLILRDII